MHLNPNCRQKTLREIKAVGIQIAHRFGCFVHLSFSTILWQCNVNIVRKLVITNSNGIFAILSDKKWQKKKKWNKFSRQFVFLNEECADVCWEIERFMS